MKTTTNNPEKAGTLSFLARLDITAKFIIAIILGLLVLMYAGNTVSIYEQKRDLDSMLNSSNNAVGGIVNVVSSTTRASEQEKIKRLVAILKKIASGAIAEFDLSALNEYASVATRDPNIVFVKFSNKAGKVLASKGNAKEKGLELIKEKVKSDGVLFGYIEVGFKYNELDKFIVALNKIKAASLSQMKDKRAEAVSMATMVSIISSVIIGICVAMMVFFLFRVMVTKRLSVLESNLQEVADGDGDLTKRVDVSSSDIIGRIGGHYNSFVEKIHATVGQVVNATGQLTTSSDHLRMQTEDAHSDIRRQSSEIDQAATAVTEMSATAHEVAKNAATAASAASSADDESREGLTIVNATIQSIGDLATEVNSASEVINQLEKDSESIGVILDVIRGIAEQTNLLALNAAIEAARAGEQGRGFAVVADEVRTLASRTQKSTEEIQKMICQLQTGTENAVKVMEEGRNKAGSSVEMAEKAGQSLQSITSAVGTITEMNMQIASAAEEQGAVAEEINQNIMSVREVSVKTSEGFESTSRSSESLSELAVTLGGLIDRFKI